MPQEDSYQVIRALIESHHPEDVNQLSLLVGQKLGIAESEALDLLLSLEGDGKLIFFDKKSDTFLEHLKDVKSSWFWAYTAITVMSAITNIYVTGAGNPLIYLRQVLGVLYVVFLPGYALVKVLYPLNQVNIVVRLALSITLSLVVVPMIGYLLNFSPWGIGLMPVNLSILFFSFACAVAGLYREYQVNQRIKSVTE